MADTPTVPQNNLPPLNWWDNYRAHFMMGANQDHGNYRLFLEGMGAGAEELNAFDESFKQSIILENPQIATQMVGQIAALRTPDEIMSGYEFAAIKVAERRNGIFGGLEQGGRDLFDRIRDNTDVQGSLHTAITNNPAVFPELLGIVGDQVIGDTPYNVAALAESLEDPAVMSGFVAGIGQMANNPADNLLASLSSNGVSVGASEQITKDASYNFLASLTGAGKFLGIGGYMANGEMMRIGALPEAEQTAATIKYMVDNEKTAADLLNAFEAASPDAKPMLDIIRADTDLANALHGAVLKDSTVLEGISGLVSPGSAVGPNMIAEALADPQTRQGVITMLERTGEDDDLTFADLSNALESGAAFAKNPNAPGAADRYRNALARFNLEDNRIVMAQLMADPGAALMQMIQDPHTFFANIRAALGNIAPGGFVDGLLSTVEHGIASWTQDPQIHSFMQEYNIAAGVQELQNVHANLGIVEIADAPATTNPAPSNDQASVEIPAVTNFNQGLSQHAGTGVQVASVDYGNIQIGEAGKGFARDGFNSPASGIVPKDEIQTFGNAMVASVKNDSMQFGMAV